MKSQTTDTPQPEERPPSMQIPSSWIQAGLKFPDSDEPGAFPKGATLKNVPLQKLGLSNKFKRAKSKAKNEDLSSLNLTSHNNGVLRDISQSIQGDSDPRKKSSKRIKMKTFDERGSKKRNKKSLASNESSVDRRSKERKSIKTSKHFSTEQENIEQPHH